MRWRLVNRGSHRTLRWAGLAMVSVITTLGAAAVLVPVVVRGLVQAFGLLLRGSIWLATAVGRGDDTWTIASALGRGVATALLTPGALGVVGGLLLVGALAVLGLQRLLESEDREESFR
ncbi:MAG: hypothetical protein AB7N65_12455 [Vicinamibacterales bacterium]